MRYFADYMKEIIYAVDDNGDGVSKCSDGTFNVHKKEVPWLSEENGVGFLVEEITKEDFKTYQIKWDWGVNDEYEHHFEEWCNSPHSWRKYTKTINP